MNRICVMLMSCNDDFFLREEEVVRNTWLKSVIEGKYPNIDYYFYTSGENTYIDEKNHRIIVKSEDDWSSTFDKTQKAFRCILDKDFDYVLRVNLSTYVNLKLLMMFFKFYLEQCNDSHIWGTELLRAKGRIYMIGKFLLFPRWAVQKLAYDTNDLNYTVNADDWIIGNIFEDNDFKQFKPYNAFPREGCEAWNHDILSEDDTNIKRHICMSYRVYPNEDREEKEFKCAYKIHSIMQNAESTLEDLAYLLSYHNNMLLDINAKMYTFYKRKFCVVIPVYKEKPTEEFVQMFKEIHAKTKGDLYIVCPNNLDMKSYYECIGNRYLDLCRVENEYNSREGLDRLLTNKSFWHYFFTAYEYCILVNESNPMFVNSIDERFEFIKYNDGGCWQCRLESCVNLCDENEYVEGMDYLISKTKSNAIIQTDTSLLI